MDYANLLGMFLSAVSASVLTRILTIRARVRQEKAGAAKAETEVKADQIENIEKLVEKAYKPIIEDLTRQINALQEKVEKLENEKDAQNERIDELEAENRRLRAALRETCPESLHSLRGENGKTAPRSSDGRFVKRGES